MVPKKRKGDLLSNFGDQKTELRDQTKTRLINQCFRSSYTKVDRPSKWNTKPKISSERMNQNILIKQI